MDKRIKIIAYSAIAAFSILFTVLIGIFVVKPLIHKNELQIMINEREAIQAKKVADSIIKQVDITVDSIVWKHHIDSLTFEAKKESLAYKYKNKIKKYEARIADIDTMDIQLNSSFSVRNMLSDSACKVW